MSALLKGNFRKATAILIAVVAATAATTLTFAGEGDERADTSEAGVPIVLEAPPAPEGGAGSEEGSPIHTGFFTSTYDPTYLTKFIPASAFAGDVGDILNYPANQVCQDAQSSPATTHELRAPLELPDGSKIQRFTVYGEDTDAANMTITLDRTTVDFPFLGTPSVDEDVVASINTSAASGTFGISNSTDLNEVTGNFFFLGGYTTFYEMYVSMPTSAGTNHLFCGVEVTYQVPAIADASAQAFYPISPIRVFDSRQAAYAPLNGLLAPNTSRIVNIKDGRDSNGTINFADAIPSGATAVTYNITVTSTTAANYLAVTPGDAGSFTASAINFGAGDNLANAATVSLASDLTIKIWCGDQTGSTHVIIDITGYYGPLPNMGN